MAPREGRGYREREPILRASETQTPLYFPPFDSDIHVRVRIYICGCVGVTTALLAGFPRVRSYLGAASCAHADELGLCRGALLQLLYVLFCKEEREREWGGGLNGALFSYQKSAVPFCTRAEEKSFLTSMYVPVVLDAPRGRYKDL